MVSNKKQIVVFRIDGQRHAVPVGCVQCIYRIVEITPLPQPHPPIMGVINIQGRIVPVINTRKMFHLPEREIELDDQMVLIQDDQYEAALWVDRGTEVITSTPEQFNSKEQIPQSLQSCEGVMRLPDGLVFLHSALNLMQSLKDWHAQELKE